MHDDLPVQVSMGAWPLQQAIPNFVWMAAPNKYSPIFLPSCQSSIRSTFTEKNSGLFTMALRRGNRTLLRVFTTRSRSATLVALMDDLQLIERIMMVGLCQNTYV